MKLLKSIKGRIVKGNGLGRQIGFPTLNMEYEGEERGIFVAKVCLNGEWFKAATHIGERPVIDDKEIVLEMHVLDWDGQNFKLGDLVEVELYEKIREVMDFDGWEDLKKQIAKDISYVRNYEFEVS